MFDWLGSIEDHSLEAIMTGCGVSRPTAAKYLSQWDGQIDSIEHDGNLVAAVTRMMEAMQRGELSVEEMIDDPNVLQRFSLVSQQVSEEMG